MPTESATRNNRAAEPATHRAYQDHARYDNNGNLARKVDARDVTVCFGVWNGSSCNAAVETGYDQLNRVLRKQYSATTPATPGVTYTYDCATNGKGLPCGIANSESASNISAYDKLGRVTASSQVMAGVTYPMSYGWDIVGNKRSMTLPSARTLTWSYDNAARATGVTGAKAGEANRTYASGMNYAAHGGLANFTMGNSTTETWAYNSRMQPRQVSAVRSGTTQLGLGFYYCGSQVHTCSDNNGNPRIETIAIPGKSWTRSFGYDGWNRVSTASEGADSRNFGYSATGNMWVTTASGGWTPPSFTPRTSAWFDANNRLVSSQQSGGYTTTYAYDGEGRRVKKTTGTTSTWFVYNAMGELAAEYLATPPSGAAATHFVTTDHLGSTRLVTDGSGNVVSRHDYLPFGEEIPSGYGGRTTAMKYVSNADLTQRFTGKERDTETRLDYFGARYMSPAQGRFTSPDPLLGSANPLNPQSWNRYTYTLNNPLRYTDPFGLYEWDATLGGSATDDELRKQLSKKAANKIIDRRNDIRKAIAKGVGSNDADVSGAYQAYGAEGEANGVTIASQKPKSGGVGAAGQQLEYVDGSFRSKATVSIDPKQSGNDLFITLAHEGSHVRDGQAYAAAAGRLGDVPALAPFNLTVLQTEMNAYSTSVNAARMLGLPNLNYSAGSQTYQIWRGGTAAVDRPVLEQFLRASPLYAPKLTNLMFPR